MADVTGSGRRREARSGRSGNCGDPQTVRTNEAETQAKAASATSRRA